MRRPGHLLRSVLLVVLGAVLWGETESEVFLVLPDAARRERSLSECTALLADPDAAVDQRHLLDLTLALARDGDRPVAGLVHQGSMTMSTVVDAIAPDGTSRRTEAFARVRQAILCKQGEAWIHTWNLLRRHGLSPTPDLAAMLPQRLAALAAVRRGAILAASEGWSGWGSPALSALLLRWVEEPAPDHAGRRLRSDALDRLLDTDPEAGRARVLRAIRDGDEAIAAAPLLRLPDEVLPEFDEVFREGLLGEPRANAILCACRYGSPAILPAVRARYDHGERQWACDLGAAMLRFLVRHDPPVGLRLVREAMAMRGPGQTRCWRSLLPEVFAGLPGADIDALLEDYVDDPDHDVGISAITAFARRPAAAERLRSILEHHDETMPLPVRTAAQRWLEPPLRDRLAP